MEITYDDHDNIDIDIAADADQMDQDDDDDEDLVIEDARSDAPTADDMMADTAQHAHSYNMDTDDDDDYMPDHNDGASATDNNEITEVEMLRSSEAVPEDDMQQPLDAAVLATKVPSIADAATNNSVTSKDPADSTIEPTQGAGDHDAEYQDQADNAGGNINKAAQIPTTTANDYDYALAVAAQEDANHPTDSEYEAEYADENEVEYEAEESKVLEQLVSEDRDVIVHWNGVEYALFASSQSDDPDSYFFEDDTILKQPLNDFFATVRGVLEQELSMDTREVLLSVSDLNLTISDVSPIRHPQSNSKANFSLQTDYSCSYVTLGHVIDVHTTLLFNEGVDGELPSIHIDIAAPFTVDAAFTDLAKQALGMNASQTPLTMSAHLHNQGREGILYGSGYRLTDHIHPEHTGDAQATEEASYVEGEDAKQEQDYAVDPNAGPAEHDEYKEHKGASLIEAASNEADEQEQKHADTTSVRQDGPDATSSDNGDVLDAIYKQEQEHAAEVANDATATEDSHSGYEGNEARDGEASYEDVTLEFSQAQKSVRHDGDVQDAPGAQDEYHVSGEQSNEDLQAKEQSTKKNNGEASAELTAEANAGEATAQGQSSIDVRTTDVETESSNDNVQNTVEVEQAVDGAEGLAKNDQASTINTDVATEIASSCRKPEKCFCAKCQKDIVDQYNELNAEMERRRSASRSSSRTLEASNNANISGQPFSGANGEIAVSKDIEAVSAAQDVESFRDAIEGDSAGEEQYEGEYENYGEEEEGDYAHADYTNYENGDENEYGDTTGYEQQIGDEYFDDNNQQDPEHAAPDAGKLSTTIDLDEINYDSDEDDFANELVPAAAAADTSFNADESSIEAAAEPQDLDDEIDIHADSKFATEDEDEIGYDDDDDENAVAGLIANQTSPEVLGASAASLEMQTGGKRPLEESNADGQSNSRKRICHS